MCQKAGIECTFVSAPEKKRRIDPSAASGGSKSMAVTRNGSPSEPHYVDVPPMSLPPKCEVPDKEPPLIPNGFDSSIYLGVAGDQDPYLLQYYKYDDSTEMSTFIKYGIRRVDKTPSFPVQFLAIRNEEREKMQAEVQEQRRRVYSMASKYEERLLALYFRFAYPTYPIVDRESFYHDYYHNKDNINIGLLAGLLALSCIWWKYDSVLCVNVMPRGLYNDLYRECRIAVEREAKYPSLASVQCLLLLLQRRLQPSETADTYLSYVDIARLVAISHNLGLHLDCTNWSISPSLKKLRKRLWTTVYIMEKWTSANTGRPSLLHWDNSTISGYESSEPSAQLFVQMCRLTNLLDEISQDLYSLRNLERRYFDVKATRAKVDDFFERLRHWQDSLPEELKDMQAAPQGDFAKNGTLNLAALTVEVLLHKIRLHPICSGLVTRAQLCEDRAAAYETIEKVIKFTSEITHSHLHAFWYATKRLNFSTIAHFIFFHHVTSLTPQELRDTRENLRKWLFALRVLAQGWEEGTGLAALRMDSVFWMGEELFDVTRTPGLNGKYNYEEPADSTKDTSQASQSSAVQGPAHNSNTTNGHGDLTYMYPFGQNDPHSGDENTTSWHNPIDDDMLLLNEDIMPQSDQTHLLQEDVPEDLANAYAEYFTAEKFHDEGFLTSDLHNIFQVHTNAGFTPEPTFD